MKSKLIKVVFSLCVCAGLSSFSYGQADVTLNTQSTVVRAYPNGVENPEQGGNYIVELDEEINLDVRGLGIWFIKLQKRGVESEVIKTFITPALDSSGNIKISPEDWTANVVAAAKNLCLYLDGRPFNNILPIRAYPKYLNAEKHRDATGCPLITLKYSLKRDTQGGGVPDAGSPTYKQWDNLVTTIYGRMKSFNPEPTDLTVGFPGKDGIGFLSLTSALNPTPEDNEPHGTIIRIRPFSLFWMGFCVLFLIGVMVAGFFLAKKSDLVRDTVAIPNPGGRYPFSLARCQLALWTVVILGSYLFIWLSTQDYNRLAIQSVGLLGISAATGLCAVAVNRKSLQGLSASSLSPAELDITDPQKLKDLIAIEKKALELLEPNDPKIVSHETRILELGQRLEYVSSSWPFFSDILNEENSVSLHRFQLVIWTLVLACIFVRAVIATLQMPVFDSTILILMGISSGTYVGFKFPSTK